MKEEPQAHFSKCYAVSRGKLFMFLSSDRAADAILCVQSLEHGKLSFFKTVDDFNELGNTFGGAAPLPLKHYKFSSSRSVM